MNAGEVHYGTAPRFTNQSGARRGSLSVWSNRHDSTYFCGFVKPKRAVLRRLSLLD